MSRGVDDNIGIVGYKTDDEYSCITMVALDLSTGRPLWQRKRGPLPGVPFHTDIDEVAVAGQVVVSREAGFVAMDLRSGKPRWRKAAGSGCEDYSVTAEGDTAVLLSACKSHIAQLVVVDVATGRERWHAQLHTSADDESAMGYGAKSTAVLSVDPLVIRTSDDDSGAGAFVSFDGQGRKQATVSQSQQDADLAPGRFPYRGARAAYAVNVVGDVLVTPARKVGDSTDRFVAAYSLTDGRRLWITELDDTLASIVATQGEILVQQHPSSVELLALAPQDGRILQKRTFDTEEDKISQAVDYAADVRVAGEKYVFIGTRGDTAPPVVVLR
jgi:outer membrane protein assembly factor BamB